MTIQPFQPTAKNSRYAIPAAPNRVRQRAMDRLIMRRICCLRAFTRRVLHTNHRSLGPSLLFPQAPKN
jgi:hypothetical protein